MVQINRSDSNAGIDKQPLATGRHIDNIGRVRDRLRPGERRAGDDRHRIGSNAHERRDRRTYEVTAALNFCTRIILVEPYGRLHGFRSDR